MSEQFDVSTLNWVKAEIDETLHEARLALEKYVDNPEDETQIHFCATHLHQVRGTLQMVELNGAYMLAEEMERLADNLPEAGEERDKAFDVLMRTILLLPDYLESLQTGLPDSPVILLPLINELRRRRGESELSRAAVFRPDLSVMPPESFTAPELSGDLQAIAAKLRPHFQAALLKVLKGEDTASNLKRMGAVLVRLAGAKLPAHLRQWAWVGTAFIEALLAGGLAVEGTVKQLLGKNEQLLKYLASHGAGELREDAVSALVRALLYEIGKAEKGGKNLRDVREAFQLENLLPSPESAERLRGNLGGFNAELKQTVSRDVLEELSRIQDVLDLFGRGRGGSAADLQPVADGMERILDILDLLRQDSLRALLDTQLQNVRRFIQAGSAPDEKGLMDIASSILSVESALRDWGVVNPVEKADDAQAQLSEQEGSPEAEAEHHRVIRQVMKESKDELVRAREAISTYLHEEQKRETLELVVQQLRLIAGSLSMLSYKRAALIVEAARRFTANELMEGASLPSAEALDALADAMMSIEYYLEAFVESRVHPSSMLDVAERAVANLGYPVDEVSLEPEETIEIQPPAEPEDDVDQGPEVAGQATPELPESVELEPAATPSQPADPQAQEHLQALESEPEPVQPAPAPEAPEVDDEIAEIFAEEAEEELARIADLLPECRANPSGEAIQDVRRAFHTLKGSGRLVGASRLGEFAWSFENMLNRVLDGTVPASAAVFDAVQSAQGALEQLLAEFRGTGTVTADISALDAAAWALSKGETPELPPANGESTPVSESAPGISQEPALEVPADAEEGGADAGQPDSVPDTVVPQLELDDTLRDIYAKEAQSHLETLEAFLDSCAPRGCRVTDELIRALHTLTGSSRAAGVELVAEVTSRLEKYAKLLDSSHQRIDEEGRAAIVETAGFVGAVLTHLYDSRSPLPDGRDLHEAADLLQQRAKGLAEGAPAKSERTTGSGLDWSRVTSVREEAPKAPEPPGMGTPVTDDPPAPESTSETGIGDEAATDEADATALGDVLAPETGTDTGAAVEADTGAGSVPAEAGEESPTQLLEIFANEADDLLKAAEEPLQRWVSKRDDHRPVELLQRHFHTLKGSARWADVQPMAALAHSLESTLAAVVEGRIAVSEELVLTVEQALGVLSNQVRQLRNGQPLTPTDALAMRLEQLVEEGQQQRPEREPAAMPDYDPDLMAIFLEEAEEILDGSDETLQAWIRHPSDRSLVEKLQRDLHTLKGGARMAGIREIGDLGHGVESMMAAVADGLLEPNARMFHLVQRAHDTLAVMVEQVRNHDPLPPADELLQGVEEIVSGQPAAAPEAEPASGPVGADEIPPVEEPPRPIIEPAQEPAAPAPSASGEEDDAHGDRRQRSRPQHEMIRVRSDLLDSLVNVAGESSIFRSRVEQQVGSFRGNLDELENTVERLREQLRTMDIQTEAQIQSRYEEAANQGYEDFDPLEFDRFTQMQQLSRSMMESLSDVSNLEETMDNIMRETETLLLQQGRVNTELQEGLMHTRMVPLVQNAPRLRRIVRQTATEVGRQVELRFQGAEVEMDRNVVERILAPLEHLLRNAIAHGIEPPEQRRAAGKAETGTIVIAQAREGAEVVVQVSDDGSGIDVDAVREKAIARGLLSPDADLPDAEILPFILESGFSTAESLNQIAGRGVGMDVVNSEIKDLNGSLSIESSKGNGAVFTIRLPLTLTVSRALMVYIAEDTYAVPLLGISGVVRASREELAELFAQEQPRYHWLEQEFDLLHLGSVLGVSTLAQPGPEGQRPALLLVNTGEQRVALVVDGLLGSREIVVKPVGRQLSTVRGLSGATILGDGRVALILELPAVVRLGLSKRAQPVTELEASSARARSKPVVMVVDDSITVRKVTSRLLERNGFHCVAAKDGVEALAALEETRPDVMLLDIEMPRMDGYEVATHVRNSPELRDIPIIMITSRSGDKHRERAMQIGVNVYMSKPFQEAELLERVRSFTDEAGYDAVAGTEG
jgi:chemosensory pili system protein ChpA (sensor histidine kinase/response regulator)